VHKLSRQTHLISPRDLFTARSVESFMTELSTWRSREPQSQYTRGISRLSSALFSF